MLTETLIRLKKLSEYLSTKALGGPRVLKLSWVINVQKAGTLPFVLLLIYCYDNTSPATWLYAALHGGHGLSWLLKDLAFPDPSWQRRVTYGGAALSFIMVLGPYWVLPWLLVSGIFG